MSDSLEADVVGGAIVSLIDILQEQDGEKAVRPK